MNLRALDRRIGLVLAVATLASMALVVFGVTAMAVSGVEPLTRGYPALAWDRLGPGVLGLDPDAVLWLGLIAVILTPTVRVAASFVGFAAAGERRQAGIALVVFAIMILGVALGHGG
jgi:uncharacterized membrane protein